MANCVLPTGSVDVDVSISPSAAKSLLTTVNGAAVIDRWGDRWRCEPAEREIPGAAPIGRISKNILAKDKETFVDDALDQLCLFLIDSDNEACPSQRCGEKNLWKIQFD